MNFFKRHWHARQIEQHRDYLLDVIQRVKAENEGLRRQLKFEQQQNFKEVLVRRHDTKQT